MGVIEIEGLRKDFRRLRGGRTVAVDGLDLDVPEGGVFGFLGPNGAGKTTTIRCLLGLVRPSAGTVRLLGADIPRGLAPVIGKVGSIVEQPALFPRFSGRRNLEILARIGGASSTDVTRVLERVSLAERAKDPVKTYSLGMKQRLGIAAALLKDPSLLVLDEPANGLDPAGIVEVRELIRSLGAEGRTVFVSSHILSEVQQTADRVAILARGRSVKVGLVSEVLEAGGARGMVVRVSDHDAALQAFAEAGVLGRACRRRVEGGRRTRRRRTDHADPGRARPLPLRAPSRHGGPGDGVPRAHQGCGARVVIRLFTSELLRAVSRRLVRFLLAVALLGALAGMILATVNSDRLTDADLRRGERQFQRDLQRCKAGDFGVGPRDLEQMGYPTLVAYCEDAVRPENYQYVDGLKTSGIDEGLQGTAPILLMLAVVLGASLVGADWSSGSMATLLTWEPRRIRVFLMRALVIAIVVFVFVVVVDAVLVALWRSGVSLRGTADASDWLSPAVETIGRVGILAIIWASFAYAAAAITRSTAGGVFVLLGELILIEAVFRGFRPSIERWVLVQNATVFVTDRAVVLYNQNTGQRLGTMTPGMALSTLVAYALVALAVALILTHRRDVT